MIKAFDKATGRPFLVFTTIYIWQAKNGKRLSLKVFEGDVFEVNGSSKHELIGKPIDQMEETLIEKKYSLISII